MTDDELLQHYRQKRGTPLPHPDDGSCPRVFYPDDDEYLVDRETTVSHFEVAAAQAG